MIKKRIPVWEIVFKLSRPSLWHYLAGAYLIGYTAVANSMRDFLRFEFIYTLFFFLIPANIILYAINDLYDKKEGVIASDSRNRKIYTYSIGISFLASIPLWVYFPLFAKLLFALFFLLIIFYSAKPIRLKAKPFVDALTNIMIAFPAFIGIYQITNSGLSLYIVLAVLGWTTAMYFFTSAHTIEEDNHLHLKTSAIKLGRWNSLLVSIIFWFIAAICAIITNYFLAFLLVYPLLPIYMMMSKKALGDKVFEYFPLINLICGVLLLLVVATS